MRKHNCCNCVQYRTVAYRTPLSWEPVFKNRWSKGDVSLTSSHVRTENGFLSGRFSFHLTVQPALLASASPFHTHSQHAARFPSRPQPSTNFSPCATSQHDGGGKNRTFVCIGRSQCSATQPLHRHDDRVRSRIPSRRCACARNTPAASCPADPQPGEGPAPQEAGRLQHGALSWCHHTGLRHWIPACAHMSARLRRRGAALHTRCTYTPVCDALASRVIRFVPLLEGWPGSTQHSARSLVSPSCRLPPPAL